MKEYLIYIPIFLIGYLIGCPNMALLLAKLKGVDLRGGGSGNPGASNAMVLMGWKAGIIVGLFDIGKGVLAVLLARYLFPSAALAGVVGGVACVLGHIFPFYTLFKGGKGFASYLGMALALNWKFALILLVAVALITLITNYIVIGTMTTIITLPIYYAICSSLVTALVLSVASVVMIYKHRENLVRIANGTEIGFRSANRGEWRADKK